MTEREKYKMECGACGATGLYQGMAERDGAAIICHRCEGKGWHWHTPPKEFSGMKVKEGIKRVFKSSCGFAHSGQDVITAEGKELKFSEAGCTYGQFIDGIRPKPVKELYCPYLWADQSMQNTKHDAYLMYEDKCSKNIRVGGRITDCPLWDQKIMVCWPMYEEKAKDWD